MKKGYNKSGGVGSIAWLDEIRNRQNNYANLNGNFPMGTRYVERSRASRSGGRATATCIR